MFSLALLELPCALTLATTLSLAPAPSLTEPELSPGTRYDPAIPTPRAVLGHDFGEEITSPEGIVDYLEALAAAAPERARLVEYARTWEGRPLVVLVVASAERIAHLDEVKRGMQRLADPRLLAPGEADRLIAELPVVVWLLHAVHGDEISSSDAALAEAYHLLAARDSDDVAAVLREAVVLIDPLENPDGRARFLLRHLLDRAAAPDPDPAAAEHDEPWPSGRSNHYLFDMNRDWFAQSQPETAGRTRLYLEWFPQVAVDLHEMGAQSTYYFAPPAAPLNRLFRESQVRWLEAFGRANAERFDQRGFPYFVREQFDSFYPGYGESWPMFHGAVGMTFEMASASGLLYRRSDDTLLSYRQGVVEHFTAAIETAVTAARHRADLLRDFHRFRQAAIDEAVGGGLRAYVLTTSSDPPRAERLARLLLAQGIEVGRARQATRVGERDLPAGSLVVDLAQPAGTMARVLLDPDTPMDRAFVDEQERRRQKRLPEQFYDVTGWSLPALFDVEAVASERPVAATPIDATPDNSPPTPPLLPPARVAYLVPWGGATAAAVVEALGEGLRAHSADRSFTLGGRSFPPGTTIFRLAENPADLAAKLSVLAAKWGIEVVATDTGFPEAGISLGSNEVVTLRLPRVLLAWDQPTVSSSAGWTRFVLERRFGQRVTAVRTRALRGLDFTRFDVLILPAGDYSQELGPGEVARLRAWVQSGGVLITLAEASRWATRTESKLLETSTELRDGRPEVQATETPGAPPEPEPQPFDLEQALEPERELPPSTPGALLRVELDTEHWLAAGSDGEIQAVVSGRRVFTPISYDHGSNVGLYAGEERLVVSGLVWPEAQAALARKTFLLHQPIGEGHLIAFAEDPNFRAFAPATELLFLNAVLLGPSH